MIPGTTQIAPKIHAAPLGQNRLRPETWALCALILAMFMAGCAVEDVWPSKRDNPQRQSPPGRQAPDEDQNDGQQDGDDPLTNNTTNNHGADAGEPPDNDDGQDDVTDDAEDTDDPGDATPDDPEDTDDADDDNGQGGVPDNPDAGDDEPQCDPEAHMTDSMNCACAGACDQPEAELCVDGQCVCDPELHAEDQENCACQGPCGDDQECSYGLCHTIPPAQYVWVPANTFLMGSPSDELGVSYDEAQHYVQLTDALYVQTTEVTQRQWSDLMGWNPARFGRCGPECPVENVSWLDAVFFANTLSESEGLQPCYNDWGDPIQSPTGHPKDCEGYRLPTEAEWEYIARAGSEEAYFTGESRQTSCGSDPNLREAGWYCNNSENHTQQVAGKAPNDFGLYDVHGNVAEWVHDRYLRDYENLTMADPLGPSDGRGRVFRGGSWLDEARNCRAGARAAAADNSRQHTVGFRLVRTALEDR